MRIILSYAFVFFMLAGHIAHAAEVENIDENIQKLGFDRFYTDLRKDKNKEIVKVAIFDYGFEGYADEKGETIPKNTEFKQRPGDTNKTSGGNNTHGLAMAQILTQYMTNNFTRWRFAPKLYLYKSDGYSNFQWAIDDAIKNGVDVILHSIVIEYGSNYDGKGFYNALVNKAANSGIIWVNAAGNFGLTTYNSDISLTKNNWVEMDEVEKNALPVKCTLPKNSKAKKCNIRLVLAWDDFKNKPALGSKKDLDLYLYDENFETSTVSELTQVAENDPDASKPGHTLYPREIIETQIDEGTSYVKVKAKSDNFASTDRLRITADGDNISFPTRDTEESLLNPADNPNVITVGEDSKRSSVSESLHKPELIAPSLVKGDDGKHYKGSSNAAAVVAAGVALMKKINPDLDRDGVLELATSHKATPEDIMNYQGQPRQQQPIMVPPIPYPYAPPELNATFIQSQAKPVQADHYVTPEEDDQTADDNSTVETKTKKKTKKKQSHSQDEDSGQVLQMYSGAQVVPQNPISVPLNVLRFGPLQGNGCFALADIKQIDPCFIGSFVVKSQSFLVVTTSGLKIATSYDPVILLSPGDQPRANLDDVIAAFPDGIAPPFRRVPRGTALPPGAIEVFKLPIDEMMCKVPDWGFLVTELDIARRQIFAANQVGTRNNFIPQTCRVDVMAKLDFPISNWAGYPILQQTPYGAPIGPAPVEIRSSYQDYSQQGQQQPNGYGSYGREGYGQQSQQQQNGYGSQQQQQGQSQYQNQNQRQSKKQGDNFQMPDPKDVKEEDDN